MGVIAVAIKHLISAGVTGDELVTVVTEMEDAITPKRSAAAERQARYRERIKASRNATGDDKKEIPPTPPKEKINNISPRAREAAEIKAELETVLSPEWAANVIAHRIKIKKPLTVAAAKGLAKRYAKCRDGPEAAAEYHVVSGNQGFEPEWYENAKRTHHNRNDQTAGVVDDLRDVIDQAEEFDRRERESVSRGGEEPSGRALRIA